MDPTDLEIRKRLDKLKEDRPPVPSEEELRSRLQKLKGEKPCALSNKVIKHDLIFKTLSDEIMKKHFCTSIFSMYSSLVLNQMKNK